MLRVERARPLAAALAAASAVTFAANVVMTPTASAPPCLCPRTRAVVLFVGVPVCYSVSAERPRALVVFAPGGLGNSWRDYEWLCDVPRAAVARLRAAPVHVDMARIADSIMRTQGFKCPLRVLLAGHSLGARAVFAEQQKLGLAPDVPPTGAPDDAWTVTGTSDCVRGPRWLAGHSLYVPHANHRFWTDRADGRRIAIMPTCPSLGVARQTRLALHVVRGLLENGTVSYTGVPRRVAIRMNDDCCHKIY